MDFMKDVKEWVKGDKPREEKKRKDPHAIDKALPPDTRPSPPPIEEYPCQRPMRDFIKIHNLYSRISSIDSIDFFDDTEQEVSVQFKNGNIIKQTIADTQDYNRIKQTLTKLFQ